MGMSMGNNVVKLTFNRITGERGRVVNRGRYMGGWRTENLKLQEILIVITHFVKYCIYVCRNRRVMPSVAFIVYEVGELISVMKKKTKWQRVIQDLSGNLVGIFED
jgi:hypothetical protein